MGGVENGDPAFMVDQKELDAFAHSEASQGIDLSPFQKQKVFRYKAGTENNPQLIDALDPNAQSAVKAFYDWKARMASKDKKHEEYVKLLQDRPGRSATMVASANPILGDTKKILG